MTLRGDMFRSGNPLTTAPTSLAPNRPDDPMRAASIQRTRAPGKRSCRVFTNSEPYSTRLRSDGLTPRLRSL